jgi:ubiquinone/menaquinone biosynthesis C-methylase UbiE
MLHRVLEPEVMDSPEEARDYEAMDHAAPNAAFVQRLVDLGAAGAMLDIGTGPGHIPLLVCARVPGCRVTGVDLSRHMLELATRRLSGSAFAERTLFRCADAKALPFFDGAFDAVFSNTILHHIPDPRTLLSEARRVLKPGGTLLIRDLYRPQSLRRADELVARHAGDASGRQQELLRQSLLAALTVEELRAVAEEVGLGPAAGFEVVVDTDRHMSLQTRLPRNSPR